MLRSHQVWKNEVFDMSAQTLPASPAASGKISSPARGIAGGLALTAILALAGWQLSLQPGLALAGPMACTLLIAVLYRNLLGYPESFRAGIAVASSRLLRAAIVLFGLKLPIDVVLQQGLPYLARAVGTLVFTLAASYVMGRWLKADPELTLLLAIGTGVCGAAAIAATAPLVGAKEQKTAMSAGFIAAIGTVFAVAYTFLQPLLPMDGVTYGVWAGLSLHEIAHVALAAAAGGPDALADGMLAKLSRVLLLVPLTFGLQALRLYRDRKRSITGEDGAEPSEGLLRGGPGPHGGYRLNGPRELPSLRGLRGLPWYLLGFLAMSLLASAHPGSWLPLPDGWQAGASQLTTLLLTLAMAGLGLSVNLRELRSAVRPLAVLLIVSVLLSILTFVSLL